MNACQIEFNPSYQEESPTLIDLAQMKGNVVIEFGANGCRYCKAASPIIEQVLSTAKLAHIKITDGRGKCLGRSFTIKLWPTLILLKSGQEVARAVRPVSVDEVQGLLSFVQN